MALEFKFRDQALPLGVKTYIMGILNVTPDSFSDGGRYFDAKDAVKRALEMEEEGADVLDLGGQSTRPGHVEIPAEEEWARLEPVLHLLRSETALPLSIDTYYPYVARRALEAGAHIINDVSGNVNPQMAEVVREYRAGWILMHTGGGDADCVGRYQADILQEVRSFFEASVTKAKAFHVEPGRLCMDMGIGFGKTYEQNLRLLGHMDALRVPGVALLTGTSRKRVIGEATGVKEADKRVYGNVSAHTAAIAGGTDFLRVHDVKASVEGAKMADAIYRT